MLSGRVTFISVVQSLNAASLTSVKLSSRVTLSAPEFLKASFPIAVTGQETPSAVMVFGITTFLSGPLYFVIVT